jgi:hypothetical protein
MRLNQIRITPALSCLLALIGGANAFSVESLRDIFPAACCVKNYTNRSDTPLLAAGLFICKLTNIKATPAMFTKQ